MKQSRKSFLVFSLYVLTLVSLIKCEKIRDFQVVLNSYVKSNLHKPIQSSMEDKIKAMSIFHKYLNEIADEQQQNQVSTVQEPSNKKCSKLQRQQCTLYALDFMKRCKPDSTYGTSCMDELLLKYPACLQCYCPYMLAKTCQASNFILWLIYKQSEGDDCDYYSIMKGQCYPYLMALFLNAGVCVWCECLLATLKGYPNLYCLAPFQALGYKKTNIKI